MEKVRRGYIEMRILCPFSMERVLKRIRCRLCTQTCLARIWRGPNRRRIRFKTRSKGLYRDVWIAAIASSRKSLATQTAAICVRFQGRRVRHEYVTMHITFLTRKSSLIYRRGLRQRVASLTLDCNGVFAISAYGKRALA